MAVILRKGAIIHTSSIYPSSSLIQVANLILNFPRPHMADYSREHFHIQPSKGSSNQNDMGGCESSFNAYHHEAHALDVPELADECDSRSEDDGSLHDTDYDDDDDKDDDFKRWISHGESAIGVRITLCGPPKTVSIASSHISLSSRSTRSNSQSDRSPSSQSPHSTFTHHIETTERRIPPLLGHPIPNTLLCYEAVRSLAESQVLRECELIARPTEDYNMAELPNVLAEILSCYELAQSPDVHAEPMDFDSCLASPKVLAETFNFHACPDSSSEIETDDENAEAAKAPNTQLAYHVNVTTPQLTRPALSKVGVHRARDCENLANRLQWHRLSGSLGKAEGRKRWAAGSWVRLRAPLAAVNS